MMSRSMTNGKVWECNVRNVKFNMMSVGLRVWTIEKISRMDSHIHNDENRLSIRNVDFSGYKSG
jgi:hypothetical protein